MAEQIINFTTGSEAATMLQPRNLIVVEQNAHVQIIERHQSLTENAVFTNVVSEIYADRHSTVDFYKIQNDCTSASLVDNTFIEQQSESVVSVHTFSFGGNITRNNLNFYQKYLLNIYHQLMTFRQDRHQLKSSNLTLMVA